MILSIGITMTSNDTIRDSVGISEKGGGGGDGGIRTPGLRIANAALSQLSYIPNQGSNISGL